MISVLVAIYNVADYLPRLIESVINQTYKDLEIILVDDGSTDGSEKICDEFACRDERISVIHTENGGLPSARNVGLRAATGDYILMVDGDDALHPQMIEILHGLITSGDYDFSMCYGEQIYDTSQIEAKQAEKIDTSEVVELTRDSCMRDLYLKNEFMMQYCVTWNKLFKRQLLNNLLFKNTASQDVEYNNRVFLRMNKAVLFPCCLYYYIQRPSSIQHSGLSRKVRGTESLALCLDTIPSSKSKYRAYCLQCLYRDMASVRYMTKSSKFYQIAVANSKTLREKTINEFLINPYISFGEKCSLIIRNYLFILYEAFIYMNEFFAKVGVKIAR